jgi:PAS domain S-box-containing protein
MGESGQLTTAIAIISIVVQLAATAVAVSLIRLPRLRWVWALLASATFLLAAGRVVALTHGTPTTTSELIYLLISALLLLGLLGIRPLCLSFHSSVGSLEVVQAELESARRRLGYVLDNAPIVIFAVDKEGTFTLSEGRGLEGLGLKPGELVGQSVFDVYSDFPEIVYHIRGALAGQVSTASVDVVDRSYEAHYTPLLDNRGNVQGVFGVAVDVSRRRQSEAQLRASKDRFRALVETTSDWVWEVDLDGVYTYVGPKVKDLLGYEPDELIGKTPFDLMSPEISSRVREEFRRIASQRVPFAGLVNTNIHKEGHELILETSGVPVFDDDGQLIGYRGIARDITSRRLAETALRASEERLNLAMLAANIGTWDWVIETNEVTWSKKVENLFGIKDGAFDGTYEMYMSLIHPDDRDHTQFAVNAALGGKVSPFHVLHRVVVPSGDTRYLEAIGEVIRDDSGKPTRMIGVVTDSTDRELADRQLRKEKETAQMYLDIVGTLMVAIDRNRKVKLINRRGCEILGYDEKDIIGEDWFDNFVPELIRDEVAEAFDQLMAGDLEPAEYYENPVITESGEQRLIAWHNTMIRDDDGEIVGTMSSGADVTDRRQAERVKTELEDQLQHSQRMETIGTLAAGIAHDFNNILSPILGYTDMAIEDSGDNKAVREDLERVLEAAHRAKELVEQILLFSKNVGREASPIHLHFIIREGLKFVRASLPTTIEIQQNVNIDSGVVKANSPQIHQVLVNLCTNAAHAMRDTGGTLRIELEPFQIDDKMAESNAHLHVGPYTRLRVIDTGRGMDEGTLERVFEPFFSTKDDGESTGLGLSVVHGIIMNHGGEISVESEPDKGTTVTVYLPHAEKVEEVLEEVVDVTGNERVLFVDDEPEIVKLGRRMLERLGYTVTTAANGEEAITLLKKSPEDFDILVSDQTMPHGTGLALTEQIRENRRDLPIVLMTGYSDMITPEKIEQLEISGLIMKPLAGKRLGAAIRKALDNNLVPGDE